MHYSNSLLSLPVSVKSVVYRVSYVLYAFISILTYTIKDVRSTASLISVLPKLIINTPSNCWSCAKEHINRFSQLLRGTSAFCAQRTTVANQITWAGSLGSVARSKNEIALRPANNRLRDEPHWASIDSESTVRSNSSPIFFNNSVQSQPWSIFSSIKISNILLPINKHAALFFHSPSPNSAMNQNFCIDWRSGSNPKIRL